MTEDSDINSDYSKKEKQLNLIENYYEKLLKNEKEVNYLLKLQIQENKNYTLMNIALEEYNDLFPEILNQTKKKFLTTLQKYIQINLSHKNIILPPNTLNKIIQSIDNEYFQEDYKLINDLLSSFNKIFCPKYLSKNFISHCKNTKNAIHKCGQKLYILSKKYKILYCIKCNKIYKMNSVSLYCEYCNKEYYTDLLISNEKIQNKKIYKPATWEKYHCDININEIMKCPDCNNILYLNEQKNLCCLKCEIEFDQTDIIWKCAVCSEEFTSYAKEYNPLVNKVIKIAIKKAIFDGIEAKPDYLPCCNLDKEKLISYKFLHKKECNGILYKTELDNKLIAVCSRCYLFKYYDEQFWLCPICKKRILIIDDIKNNNDNNKKEKCNNDEISVELKPLYINSIPKKQSNKSHNFNCGESLTTKDKNTNSNQIVFDNNYRKSMKKITPYSNIRIKSPNLIEQIHSINNSFAKKGNFISLFSNENLKKDLNQNFNNDNKIKVQKKIINQSQKQLYPNPLQIKTENDGNSAIEYYYKKNKNEQKKNIITDLKKIQNFNISRVASQKQISSGDFFLKHFQNFERKNKLINKNYHNNNNQSGNNILINFNLNLNIDSSPANYFHKKKYLYSNDIVNSNNFKEDQKRNRMNSAREIHSSFSKLNNKNNSNNKQIEKNMNNYHILTNNFNSDDYSIIKQIGEGTFGKIFEVEDINHNHFAMKKLLCNSNKEIEVIKSEYELLLGLRDSNINLIKIYGIENKKLDRTTYVMYVLMELAKCDWEKEILCRYKNKLYYKEEELIFILKNLTITFAELQRKNICHRDIKPANILICSNNIFKIADFGEAKETLNKNNADTVKQTIRGTELYMSPILFETLKKKRKYSKYILHNSYKSDVFSLGFCIFLAMTLKIEALYSIREIKDNIFMRKTVYKSVCGRYSNKLMGVLLNMLEIDESSRVDFIELEGIINNIWK